MKNISELYKLAAKLAVLAAFFCAGSIQAAQFSVNPVRIYLDGRAKSGSVMIENPSDQEVTIQAHMNAWSQDAGKDIIQPTDDLVVSPPIFKVKPKSRQVVRIGFLKKPDAASEMTYRLFLQEVPPPRLPDDPGMGVTLRMSLPVFVAPVAGKAQSALKWNAELIAGGSVRLSFSNTGNAHIQITNINVLLPDGSVLANSQAMMAYVLAGQSRNWEFKTEKQWKNETLRVMIKSDISAPGVETEVQPGS